jgi:hypothetical protein
MMLRNYRASVVLLALVAAFLVRGADDPVKELGVKTGNPIHSGFFFWEGKYVEPPYVVERKGGDILINGIVVSPSPPWPPRDFSIQDDPGEPPPGIGPRDRYWRRKWHYLSSQMKVVEARQRMIGTYKKATTFDTNVGPDGRVTLTEHETGDEIPVGLTDSWKMAIQDKQTWLKNRESKRDYYERFLRHGDVLSLFRSGEMILGGKEAITLLEVLLSDRSQSEKITSLTERGIFDDIKGDPSHQIVTCYSENENLRERFAKMLRGEFSVENEPAEKPAPRRSDGDAEGTGKERTVEGTVGWTAAWAAAAALTMLAVLLLLFALRRSKAR